MLAQGKKRWGGSRVDLEDCSIKKSRHQPCHVQRRDIDTTGHKSDDEGLAESDLSASLASKSRNKSNPWSTA